MSPRAKAWALTLGTMLLGFCLMAAILIAVFAFVAHQEGYPYSEAFPWEFILGFSAFTGIGALSGFSPEDL